MAQCISFSLTSIDEKELLALLGVASLKDATNAFDAADVKYSVVKGEIVFADNALNAPQPAAPSIKMDLPTIEALCN